MIESSFNITKYEWEVLKSDLQSLTSSHNRLITEYTTLKFKTDLLREDMDECCSVKDLQDRAIAHKDLRDTITNLKELVGKLSTLQGIISKQQQEITLLNKVKEELSSIKMYGAMIVGGALALEFFGVADKIKTIITGG